MNSRYMNELNESNKSTESASIQNELVTEQIE